MSMSFIFLFSCSTFSSLMVEERMSTSQLIPPLKSSDPRTDFDSCLSYNSVINIL